MATSPLFTPEEIQAARPFLLKLFQLCLSDLPDLAAGHDHEILKLLRSTAGVAMRDLLAISGVSWRTMRSYLQRLGACPVGQAQGPAVRWRLPSSPKKDARPPIRRTSSPEKTSVRKKVRALLARSGGTTLSDIQSQCGIDYEETRRHLSKIGVVRRSSHGEVVYKLAPKNFDPEIPAKLRALFREHGPMIMKDIQSHLQGYSVQHLRKALERPEFERSPHQYHPFYGLRGMRFRGMDEDLIQRLTKMLQRPKGATMVEITSALKISACVASRLLRDCKALRTKATDPGVRYFLRKKP